MSSYIYCKLRLINMPLTVVQMERFIAHTLLVLLDLVLYMVTFLPLRVFVLLPFHVLRWVATRVCRWVRSLLPPASSSPSKDLSPTPSPIDLSPSLSAAPVSDAQSSTGSFFSPGFSSLVNPVESPPALSLPPSRSSHSRRTSSAVSLVFDAIRLLLVLVTLVAIGRLNVSFLYPVLAPSIRRYHYIKSQTHFKLFYIIMFADVIVSLLSKVEHAFPLTASLFLGDPQLPLSGPQVLDELELWQREVEASPPGPHRRHRWRTE